MTTTLPVKKNSQQIRCLVVQLGKLGSTFQGLMALRAAKQLYPQLEIELVVDEENYESAKNVAWLKSVYPFPRNNVLHSGDEKEPDIASSVKRVAKWLSPLVKHRWDVLVNWSYTESSSFLAAVIPAKEKIGYTRGLDYSQACADDWSLYFRAILNGGISQNIHITDIYTTQLLTHLQIHHGSPVDTKNEAVTSKDFFNLEPDDFLSDEFTWSSSRRWVGIQVSSKDWSAAHWGSLVRQIIEKHPEYQIVFLGAEEEKATVRKIMASLDRLSQNRILNLVGNTSFSSWAAAVRQCHWVITTPNPVLHLASVLGTRILAIFPEEKNWLDCGPYGNGHFVVHSERKELLTPSAVYWSFAYILNQYHHYQITTFDHFVDKHRRRADFQEVYLYRSKIRPTADGGGVVYEPLAQRLIDLDDWFSIVMGQVARYWYCGWVAPIGFEVERATISPDLIKEVRQLKEGITVLQKICGQALATATLLSEKSAKLKSEKVMNLHQKEELAALSDKLKELDKLIERTAEIHDGFRAFAQMIQVMMHNLEGTTVRELSSAAAKAYQKLLDGLKIFQDWTQFTLSLARPYVVKSSRPVLSIRNQ